MQNFTDIPSTRTLSDSLAEILNNDKTAISCSSGTAFPTTNLQLGMLCFRTDQNKLYILKATSPSAVWVEIMDVTASSGKAPNAEAVDGIDGAAVMLKASNLSDLANTATARSNLGIGNVENKSSATIRSEITSGNVTGALGFAPVNKAGDTITQANAAANGLVINMPTGAANTASGLKVQGHSPSIELLDKDSVQNWYVGIDDNSANELVIGRGYGVNQGIQKAIIIDSADRVRMPYQPAFTAKSNVTYNNPASDTKMVFTDLPVNNGGYYNSSNGRFTAPVAGLYRLFASMHCQPSLAGRYTIRVNGNWAFGAVARGVDWTNAATSGFWFMNAGDYVEIWCHAGQYIHGDPAWGAWGAELVG